MPFRLARTLRAHLAAVASLAGKTVRRARAARASRAASRCAGEPLESRTLFSAATGPNIVTPFETAVEFQQVGVVFDFEAVERPVSATIDLGQGTGPQDLLVDYDPQARSGTGYAALEYAQPGDYTVTLKLVGPDGWTSSQSFPVTATARPDEPAPEGQFFAAPSDFSSADFTGPLGAESISSPTVQAVFVDSTAWTSSFRSYLASHSLGDSGYKVPDGTNQLKDLPWLNLNQVKVRFSENVTVAQNGLLLAGARTPSYVTSAFAYDSTTFTATWTLPSSLLPDKLLLQLPDTITSVATGEALDGEWANGADTYSSGDGVAGGDFAFNLNVLPGDVNQSGAVNSTDTDDTRNRQNTSTTVPGTAPNTYSVLHDVNGSGSINALDTSGVRGQEGSTFGPTEAPQGPPANAPATGFPTAKSDYLDDMYTWGAQLGTAYHGTLDGTAGVTGDTLKYTLVGAPRHGSITTVDANGNTIPPEQFDGVFYVSGGVPDGDASYVYIPHLNYEGVDMFTWKVTDVTDPLNPIDSHPASVVFEVTRQPLFANDDYYIAFLDYNGKIDSSVLYHTLLTNDFGQPIVPDPTYDHRTVTILNGGVTAQNGSVMLLDQGNFVYTPPSAGWHGRDTFTYTFTDTYTNRVSNVATVVLDVGVSAGDYSPVAYNRNATPMVGVSHDGNLWRWWHDTVLNSTGGTYPNLDWLFDNIVSPYSYGVSPLSDKGGSVSHSDAAIIYTPPALYAGWDSFTASVDAANGGPATPDATQKAWVHVDNQVPQAYAMEFSTAKGVTLSDGVTAYDPDPEGVPKVLTFRLAVGPSHGKIVFRSDGSFDYTPDPDFVGIDRFTYLANDRIADGGLATVLLEVTGNPSADLLAHRTGDRLGQAVFQSVEDSGDPTKYLVLTNNDFEEGLTDGQRDFFNDTANISLDDDLAKIKLRKIPSDPNISSVEVQLSDPGAVRLFKSDGTLLYKEGQTSSEALTLYLNSPSGYFAPLLSGDVNFYVEGLRKSTDLTISYIFRNGAGAEIARDDVHMLIADWTFRNGADEERIAVQPISTDLLRYIAKNTDAFAEREVNMSESALQVQLDGLPSSPDYTLTMSSDAGSESAADTLVSYGNGSASQGLFGLYSSGIDDETLLENSLKTALVDRFDLNLVHNPKAEVKLKTVFDWQNRVLIVPRLAIDLDRDVVKVGEKIKATLNVTNPDARFKYSLGVPNAAPEIVDGVAGTFDVTPSAEGLQNISAIARIKDANGTTIGLFYTEVAAVAVPATISDEGFNWSQKAWNALRPDGGLVPNYPALTAPSVSTKELLALNNRISVVYAGFYNKKPDVYRWAGLAAHVSSRVGGQAIANSGMLDNAARGFGRALNVNAPPPVIFQYLYNASTRLNFALYWDTIRQHFAFDEGGMPAVERMVADGLAIPDQVAAWRLIQDGIDAGAAGDAATKQQKIWDGTVDFTKAEQNVTAQRIYDEAPNQAMFGVLTNDNWFKTQLKSPVPGDNSTFGDVVPQGVNGGPANIAVAVDRWKWISADAAGVLAKWKQWSDANNNIPLAQVTFDAIDIKGLLDNLPMMDEIIALLNWRP